MGIYVAASIAGAGTGLSEVVLTGFVSLLVVACAVVMGSLGWSRFAAMVRGTPNPNPDPNPNPNPKQRWFVPSDAKLWDAIDAQEEYFGSTGALPVY